LIDPGIGAHRKKFRRGQNVRIVTAEKGSEGSSFFVFEKSLYPPCRPYSQIN